MPSHTNTNGWPSAHVRSSWASRRATFTRPPAQSRPLNPLAQPIVPQTLAVQKPFVHQDPYHGPQPATLQPLVRLPPTYEQSLPYQTSYQGPHSHFIRNTFKDAIDTVANITAICQRFSGTLSRETVANQAVEDAHDDWSSKYQAYEVQRDIPGNRELKRQMFNAKQKASEHLKKIEGHRALVSLRRQAEFGTFLQALRCASETPSYGLQGESARIRSDFVESQPAHPAAAIVPGRELSSSGASSATTMVCGSIPEELEHSSTESLGLVSAEVPDGQQAVHARRASFPGLEDCSSWRCGSPSWAEEMELEEAEEGGGSDGNQPTPKRPARRFSFPQREEYPYVSTPPSPADKPATDTNPSSTEVDSSSPDLLEANASRKASVRRLVRGFEERARRAGIPPSVEGK
ncbi:hypothetical protein ANO11243_065680 [Dothideomycetidae sp. 11243]|nr:hypothetical protein ANO11243_065680 [fungal sp. No.11243]